MANSLYDALAGGLGTEQSYDAQDPYYTSGANILRAPQVAPQNNTQALLLPLIQGLAGGALMGYGQGEANQSAYNDYSRINNAITIGASDPTALQAALSADPTDTPAPKNWTIKQGQAGLLLEALQKQNIDTEAQKRQALQDEVASKVALATNPDVLQAELDLAEGKKKAAAGSAAGNRATAAVADKLGGIISAIDSLNSAQNDISNLNGKDSVIGAGIRSLTSNFDNTDATNFNKNIFANADQVASALQGGSKPSIPMLDKTIKALTPGTFETGDNLTQRYETAKQELYKKGLGYSQILQSAGWPVKDEGNLPDGVISLDALRQRLENSSNGISFASGNSNVGNNPPQERKTVGGTTYLKVPGGWMPQ